MGDLKIYKYPFEVQGDIKIRMPAGATILTVQVQGETPCIWAIVGPEQPITVRYFRIFGTGHPLDIVPTLSRYIGTFQLLGGGYIGHLFEVEPNVT